jgi:hypothetical protein
MKPKLPGLPTFSALMLCVVLTAWLGIWGPIDLEKVWRWQTLIGAAFTGLGILAASWNVTRQMGLTARSREEDRLEKEIPGLNAAFVFMSRLENMVGRVWPVETIIRILERNGQTSYGPKIIEDIERILPTTHDQVRREIAQLIMSLRTTIKMYDGAENFYKQSQADLQNANEFNLGFVAQAEATFASAELAFRSITAEYNRATEGFETFYRDLGIRIETSRARLKLLRSNHERYLGI